jgi:hypothetical protein
MLTHRCKIDEVVLDCVINYDVKYRKGMSAGVDGGE